MGEFERVELGDGRFMPNVGDRMTSMPKESCGFSGVELLLKLEVRDW